MQNYELSHALVIFKLRGWLLVLSGGIGLLRSPQCEAHVRDSMFVASVRSPEQSTPPNMVWIPGGTFRMGSDRHYPEEAPVHRVSVDGFWIDRTPVTNRQLRNSFGRPATRRSRKLLPIRKSIPTHCRICSMPAR